MDKLKYYFFELLDFLKSGVFLKNFGGMLLTAFLLFLMVTFGLDCYTRHGQSIKMPNLEGLTMDEAQKLAAASSLNLEVIDSVFILNAKPGEVLTQEPKTGSSIKENRNIYLTITKTTADEVLLPILQGNYDFFSYKAILKRYSIESVIEEEVFNDKYQPNTILYLMYDGKKITESDLKDGVKVPKGSTVSFAVSKQVSKEVEMPDLVCKTLDEARLIAAGSGLIISDIIDNGDIASQSDAYVKAQEPAFYEGRIIVTGDSIKLYLSPSLPSDCLDN